MSFDFNTLTSKQKKVYSAIEAFIKTKGIPPSVREIGEMVGEKTPGAVQGILNRLEQKGAIKREVGMARSIQLVSNESQYLKPLYIPELKKVNSRTAGNLFSIYNIAKYHPVSPDMVLSSDECFIITCSDESLYNSGIKLGNSLIMKKTSDLVDGDIVLIIYENQSLLRYYSPGEQQNTVYLKADDNALRKEQFSKDEVIVIGKLIGKFSKHP
ncbi:MAG: LexA family transcriptional regulator [Clostridia bacterium]|nr:LexA family transcriptional regulator [Clostridia bacterium]